MKIFIESSAIFSERWGVGQSAKRLAEAYHRKYPKQQIRLFGFKFFTRQFVPPTPTDRYLKFRLIRWLPGRIFTGLFKHNIPLPIDLLIGAGRHDVIFFPNFVRWPVLYNKRTVAMIHDLSFQLYGEYSSPPNREYMLKYVPKSIAKSAHIVTISESSKRDIMKHYNTPESKISVVNPFADDIFYPRKASEIAAVRKKFNLPKQYILFVSSLEPRKNLVGILDSYSKLDKSLQDQYALVLAGGKGWLNEAIHEKADTLVKNGLNIIRTGYVADEDLPALFSGAALFIFPSFYEGFGIPPLEAMACGVPVVTSNNSSLPEVVGDAALLVDANNTSEISAAMAKILTNEALHGKLVEKGYAQAKKFSPEKSAEQLNEAISKLADRQ
jgi:glycosyltransferase involved in cell wall biosynthesis